MATYKGIQGESVEVLTSDPTPTANHEGKLWYNSTSGDYKIAIDSGGTWSSATAVDTNVQAGAGSCGIASAAMYWQGDTPPYTKKAFTYDGSSWTETPAMNRDSGAYTQGCGTTTAALASAYYRNSPAADLATCEEWNGSAWSTQNNMNENDVGRTGCGTQTAALCAGGRGIAAPSTPVVNYVESYNGTSWTEEGDITTARYAAGMHNGTQTASLCIGGRISGSSGLVEEYNGTGWTEVGDLTTARYGSGASGTTALALVYGGYTSNTQTESWNGTSWTEVADLTTGRGTGGSAGVHNTSALMISGGEPYKSQVEEWTSPTYTVKTVTVT